MHGRSGFRDSLLRGWPLLPGLLLTGCLVRVPASEPPPGQAGDPYAGSPEDGISDPDAGQQQPQQGGPADPGRRSPEESRETSAWPEDQDDGGQASSEAPPPDASGSGGSEMPPPGDPAYDAPGPESAGTEAAAAESTTQGSAAKESDSAESTGPASTDELTPQEMSPNPASRAPMPPGSALPSRPRMPPGSAGMPNGSEEMPPSGSRLGEEGSNDSAGPSPYAPQDARPPMPPPPRTSYPYPPGAGPTMPPPLPRGGVPMLPQPPPVRSDTLTRTVYQLQTEVYGIQAAMTGRPILPRLVLRIELLRTTGQDLVNLSAGRPRLRLMAERVYLELNNLKQAAIARDRPGMDRSLAIIVDLLTRMRMEPR